MTNKTNDRCVLLMPLLGSYHFDDEFEPVRDAPLRYNNTLNCIRALRGIDLSRIQHIYFVISESIDYMFSLSDIIKGDMKILQRDSKENGMEIDELSYTIVKLKSDATYSPAETVYQAIQQIGLEDCQILIKDGDNRIYIPNVPKYNFVASYSLECCDLVDPMHKSYIKTDEQGYITNCIERRVISDKFIAGMYSFRDVSLFIKAYEALNITNQSFYVSDMIYWLILNTNEQFRPVDTRWFTDFNLE